MTPTGEERLRQAAENALIFAITGDAGPCADAIAAIVEMGPVAVHAALFAWSGLTLQGFAGDQGVTPDGSGGDFWVTEVEDMRTGQRVSIDEAGSPAVRDAVRLVTCAGNQDHAMIAAITETAWNADEGETLAELMVTSVKLAADVAELLREQREGGDR